MPGVSSLAPRASGQGIYNDPVASFQQARGYALARPCLTHA